VFLSHRRTLGAGRRLCGYYTGATPA